MTSARAFCLPDVGCQGIYLPENKYQGIWHPVDTRHSIVKILPRLLRSGSTGNVGLDLRSARSYSHFRRTHTSGVFTRLAWAHCSRSIRHARRGLLTALLTRLAWARCSRGIRHAPRGRFAALLTCHTWARCSRGIRHARRGLFVAFLTRLAWARCSGEGWSQRQPRG